MGAGVGTAYIGLSNERPLYSIAGTASDYDITAAEYDAIHNASSPSADNVFATMSQVADSKRYKAFITQAGTAAPTAALVLDNTIGNVVWSRTGVGTYALTLAGAFYVDHTVPGKVEVYYDVDGNKITFERTSGDVMTLKTYAAIDTDTLADDVLAGQCVHVRSVQCGRGGQVMGALSSAFNRSLGHIGSDVN